MIREQIDAKFKELKLRVGDKVLVTMSDGRVIEAKATVYGGDIKLADVSDLARKD